MNENLDLTKILDGCPKGTELYSTVYGKVCFLGIEKTDYPIEIMVFNQKKDSVESKYFTKDGRYSRVYKGECTLFPSKDQQDWAKFERFWDKPEKETEERIITCDNIPLHWSWGKLNVEKFDVSALQPFDKVLVRNHSTDPWRTTIFGYIIEYPDKTIDCAGFYWKCCIPYNEETKHLVGKIEDCPEYYKWWEE